MSTSAKQKKGLFDPTLRHSSARHIKVSSRYDVLYALNDFIAGVMFVVGSVLFFWKDTQDAGTWLFLIGSILFTVRPGIKLARNFHLQQVSSNQQQDDFNNSATSAEQS